MSIERALRDLFEDIETCPELMAKDPKAYFRQFRPLPPVIGVGDGRIIYLSQRGANAIARISHSIRGNSRQLQTSVSESEMAKLISTAIGELIVGDSDASVTEFSLPTDVIEFKKRLRQCIHDKLANILFVQTHLFGAWVFQGEVGQPVNVGSVRFLPKEIWLREAVQSGLMTKIRAARITKRWKGGRVRRRNLDTFEEMMDEAIIEAVGSCPWVCAVDVQEHSATRSREKALIAARIALAAIGLSWQTPSISARQTGLLFDLGPGRLRTTVSYSGDRFVGCNSDSVVRLGRHLPPTDAAGFAAEVATRFQSVGAALDTFLTAEPQGPKVHLEGMLCLSLMWFGEACREPLDFLAIVKFAAALDTLAKGTRATGICYLIEKRLAVKDMDAPFLKDGTSAKRLVERIYDTGRSRIIHGSRPSLVEDLGQLRAEAELLTTVTLRTCIKWLQSYSGADDGNAFRMP